MKRETPTLPYLSQEARLSIYQLIVDGCQHLWSKGAVQEDKVKDALEPLVKLGQTDPYFLARLASWAVDSPSKDLKVLTTFANSLSSADGRPFSAGSKYSKPNLRYISSAAVCKLEPKLAWRVREIAGLKFGVDGVLNEGTHFPTFLNTALKKYLRYREANLEILRGIKKAGLGRTIVRLYRSVHMAPSYEAAAILRWAQKDKEIEFEESAFGFEKLTDLDIARKIQEEKLPVLGAIGALPRKMSPVIAVALLEQATGNQAIILRKTFEDAGVLKVKEVMKLYESKIKEAKTAVDRVDTLAKTASAEVKKALKKAKATVRKEEVGEVGKVYLHLDFSGSMQDVIEFAKERGATIAECVKNPKDNFRWGRFADRGEELPLPEEFVEDAFKATLFGIFPTGSTDVFARYPAAREFGADVDVVVTDQGHNVGDLEAKIRKYHEDNPDVAKPKACVIVNFDSLDSTNDVQNAYEANGIPVAVMKPDTLTAPALVANAVREAIKGPMAVIDSIMDTDFLKLPEWYFTI